MSIIPCNSPNINIDTIFMLSYNPWLFDIWSIVKRETGICLET